MSRQKNVVTLLAGLALSCLCSGPAPAAPALEVLGRDYEFPNAIEGAPHNLSDFKDLRINFFTTKDGVKLAYWEAGKGRPLVFIPGAGANGAEYVNLMYLLREHYHVYVLDPRNHGLSQKVDYGMRISRFAMDLKEFTEHLGLKEADFCGWSMGASVLWSYVDLFGTEGIGKLVFIDEPISIYGHSDWTEQQKRDAASITDSAEDFVGGFTGAVPITNPILKTLMERSTTYDSPWFANSEKFAREFIKTDLKAISLFMFDHITNDWSDVLRAKMNVPVAIFTGDWSANVSGQRWMHSVIPDSVLRVWGKDEHGDHFLHFKDPPRFTRELREFLEGPAGK